MTVNIWRFTDSKPGHDSQSIGLCDAIARLITVSCFDIHASSKINSFSHFLFKKFPPGKSLPDPDFIIGAGHGTHIPMLAARNARNGKIIVLMKPSLPLSLFDYCVIPKHDLISEKNNIITTTGALNPIQFNNNKLPDRGLILLGGLSKHYQWDNESIDKQVRKIIDDNPDIKWAIADSPRTPETTSATIRNMTNTNLEILDYSQTSTIDIRKHIFNASTIWITQDSVSMIYESLSSGASVGLIELHNINSTKAENTISALIKENRLTPFSKWETVRSLPSGSPDFDEANRCAKLLLHKRTL
ncbi:MAG: nucleoside-diphosphate sugar epimerase [marine bacterium B5-7]|nr:MAG: nucleoside-diphosphate sugar epimerase [marine bacterium B5-7]